MMSGFSVPAHIAGESVDGETIVIDFLTGAYHTLEGRSAEVWALLHDVGHAAPDDEQVRVLEAMVEAGLVTAEAPPATEGTALNGEHADPAAFGITSYTDMAQLLLADPVHEVDDRGWPILRKP